MLRYFVTIMIDCALMIYAITETVYWHGSSLSTQQFSGWG